MLTCSAAAAAAAADAAAAAVAAVVAAAASGASAAARGLGARRRAGRCVPTKHTRARTTRTGVVLAIGGNERLCGDFDGVRRCLQRGVPTGAPPGDQTSRCRGCTGGRSGDDRGNGSRGGSGNHHAIQVNIHRPPNTHTHTHGKRQKNTRTTHTQTHTQI